jgi:exonuclease III
MKFVSWNVNGLRACVGKGFVDIFQDFDAERRFRMRRCMKILQAG